MNEQFLNKVMLGDCLNLLPEIETESIDMILCDLPYGTTQCKWDSILPLNELWREYNRIIKDNGAIVLTAVQPFTTTLINSNINNFKHSWVWDKDKGGNPLNAKYQPMKVHEDILVFGKKRVNYYPIMEKRGTDRVRTQNTKQNSDLLGKIDGFKVSETHNEKLRYPKSILTFKKNWRPQDSLHPTQKPVELFEYLIKTYTNEGDTVLDNCVGSGTTSIAAIHTRRNFISFELEKEYFDIANERINKELVTA